MTPARDKLRVALILPGLGRVQRGAETAFLEIASALREFPDLEVQLFGSGPDVPNQLPIHVIPCAQRERFERWPKLPVFRTECHYEEFSFVRQLHRSGHFRGGDFDAVIHCTYPFVNWMVQRAQRRQPGLTSLFVTQNGDWMCRAGHREYRYFKCDGLVAINPEYQRANQQQHRAVLIPNGTDTDIFRPRAEGEGQGNAPFRPMPAGKKSVLMVSALIDSKRVLEGVRATALVEDAYLVIAGDGPLRSAIGQLAEELMPGRHYLLGSVHRDAMPALFRAADVFLHMSQVEPFGIVYLEAAASGLPIVTHDGPTPRWILGDTALYADSNQLVEVADAIRQACEPETALALGAEARQRVISDWTWRAQAAKYRGFLRALKGLDNDFLPECSDEAIDRHRQLQHATTS